MDPENSSNLELPFHEYRRFRRSNRPFTESPYWETLVNPKVKYQLIQLRDDGWCLIKPLSSKGEPPKPPPLALQGETVESTDRRETSTLTLDPWPLTPEP